ncbi:MAG: ATP-binding cassette domain-containing protein [Spirochaetaceae bacterium]|nr:ATP-binding cassette domain-containing protein [Spirochaetaceae bacterium]
MDEPSLLSIREVSNVYESRSHGLFGRRQRRAVLDKVSLDMRPGEIFGLVGESGCGKTTLGRCILGLIDYRGEILIDGLRRESRSQWRERSGDSPLWDRSCRCQAVFQDPAAALNPVKRIGWLLEEPLRIHRIGTAAERRKRVDEMLDLVGLENSCKTRRARELSVGQKQRAAIGCALMLRPRLLIADEAVSALDVSVGAQILNLFRELNDTLSLGILFISHNVDLVYYLCDRIAVMREGRILETGAAEEVYSAPRHPYTKELLAHNE